MTMLFHLILGALVLLADSTPHHDVRRADDISFASLEALIQQQAAAIESLRTTLTATQNQVADLNSLVQSQAAKISTLEAKLESAAKEVGFTVRFSRDPVNDVGSQAVLRFDHIVTNDGGGYDPHTGIFTAPAAGLYLFSLDMMTTNDHSGVELSIAKDGTEVAVTLASGQGEMNDRGSLVTTLHLAVGNKVWAQHHWGETTFRGGVWTVFTGVLIQAD